MGGAVRSVWGPPDALISAGGMGGVGDGEVLARSSAQ